MNAITIPSQLALEELWSGKAEEKVKPSIHGGVTIEELRRTAVPAVAHCGVYFLLLDGDVVYIGQSTNVFQRIASYIGLKEFDAYAWLPVEPENLGWVEAMYIAKFKPAQNRQNKR